MSAINLLADCLWAMWCDSLAPPIRERCESIVSQRCRDSVFLESFAKFGNLVGATWFEELVFTLPQGQHNFELSRLCNFNFEHLD